MPGVTYRSAKAGNVRPGRNVVRLVGDSGIFRSVVRQIHRIAPRDCPVVVVGETGTGKDLVARNIHARSKRSSGIFMPVDCSLLTDELFESQLFGHVRGAFSGAVSDSIGFIRAADGGTVFLDEIQELGLNLQAKLLRVVQEDRVFPLGSTDSHPVDIRVICASNIDLSEMVLRGLFRADLYYRLNVMTLPIPPLRERREDIAVLAEHFLSRQAELYAEPPKVLSAETLDLLRAYNWPGNVRQLANVIERAHIVSPDKTIQPSALPPEILTADMVPAPGQAFPSLDQFTRKVIIRALEASDGRKAAAARLLRIDYGRINRLIGKYKLRS